MKFVVITGRSGSGKSSCLHLLEDLGYYCIDNLPISLLTSLADHLLDKEKIAIGVDVRNLPNKPEEFEEIIQQLNKKHIQLEVIYLDTDTQILLERFSNTRRKHPLSNSETSLREALTKELEVLEPVQQLAKYRIDTSRLSIHQLQQQIREIESSEDQHITILFQSFGFKYGLPTDSDFVFDVRCLPNPYWNKDLRALSGKDEAVINFLADSETVQKMSQDITKFIANWLPLFRADNRNYMTVSVGCTGGRHRSVYITECLYAHFKHLEPEGLEILVRNRDLGQSL
jgi:UPF0042 nucleotide-binding protein